MPQLQVERLQVEAEFVSSILRPRWRPCDARCGLRPARMQPAEPVAGRARPDGLESPPELPPGTHRLRHFPDQRRTRRARPLPAPFLLLSASKASART